MAIGYLTGVIFTPTLGGLTDWLLSAAVTGYQSLSAAGAVNGDTYYYRAESADLSQWEIGSGAYTSATGTIARTTILFSSTGSKVNFSVAPRVGIIAPAEGIRDATNLFNTGTVPTARLGSGTANSSSFLRGDQAWTAVTVPVAASAAEQEAASSTSVYTSPGTQHRHPSASKFWANWTANSTAILASHNVTSIADTAGGKAAVTIDTDFSSANYAVVASVECADNDVRTASVSSTTAKAAGSVSVISYLNDGSLADGVRWSVTGYGDQ